MKRIVLALLLLSGPAWAAPCDVLGGHEMVRAELLFGRTHVSNAAWADFLRQSVTPRFPDGLTVLDGKGQWRNPAGGEISREASSVLVILTPEASDLKARLSQVREDYKTRFRQQSVGLVISTACADF